MQNDDVQVYLSDALDQEACKPTLTEALLSRVIALQDLDILNITIIACLENLCDDPYQLNDDVIELTSFEYKIIEFLMIRAGQVISKAELTDRLYDQDFERDSNVIEVFIGRLRKKMDPDNTIKPIETLRGRGYRFALERNQSG